MKLKTTLFGRRYQFSNMNDVQAKESNQMSDDELAGKSAYLYRR